MPKTCPQCAAELAVDGACPDCGYGRKKSSTKNEAARDPEPWRCAHEILGQRCPNAGPIKRGDRWLCALHAGKLTLEQTLSATVGREAIAKARAMLKAAKPLKRVGQARPLQEFTAPFEQAVDEWEAGRE